MILFYRPHSDVIMSSQSCSYTFDKIQESSETVWRYYRYGLVYEYFNRPTLAPPLIIINHVVRFFNYTYRKCNQNEKISTDFSEL